jgi:hypothetical protein
MNSKKCSLFVALVAVLALSSCSGLKTTCTTNCGTTGNAKVNVTLYDTPPTGVSVLSFSLPIAGISLTPTTGSDVSIYSPTTIAPTEITHLQTDSALIVSGAAVPAGSYTAVKITLTASKGVFINTSGSTITWTSNPAGSCANGAVCNLPNGAAATITVPLTLTLSSNVTQWIGLNVNLNNAITSTNGISVDFTLPNIFTATTTVRTGLPTGAVDTIEDFTGTVTAVSSSSITVQSGVTGQSMTAAINASTALVAASSTYSNSNCTGTVVAACIATGSVASLDATLTSTGTITASEIDVLDLAAKDEVEGIIYPTATANVVGLILADKTSASGNAVLGASTTTFGTGIFLTANSGINFTVDTKTLTSVWTSPVGFSGSGDLLAGQQVRAQVSSVTSDSAGIHATASNVILRYSRISATVNTVTNPTFTVTGIPSYISTINTQTNPGFSLTPVVNTFPTATLYDGITSITDSKFVVGSPVAIRALFLNNAQENFQAAKVRVP